MLKTPTNSWDTQNKHKYVAYTPCSNKLRNTGVRTRSLTILGRSPKCYLWYTQMTSVSSKELSGINDHGVSKEYGTSLVVWRHGDPPFHCAVDWWLPTQSKCIKFPIIELLHANMQLVIRRKEFTLLINFPCNIKQMRSIKHIFTKKIFRFQNAKMTGEWKKNTELLVS